MTFTSSCSSPDEARKKRNGLGQVFGNNAYVTDGVQRALGRPPRDFTAFARAAAATSTWEHEAAS